MVNIVQDVIDLSGYFTEVAITDPLSALLLLMGTVLVVVPSVVFGGLAALGIADWIIG